MHLNSYQVIATKVNDVATQESANAMAEAAETVWKVLRTSGDKEQLPDVCASCDGYVAHMRSHISFRRSCCY